MARTLRSAMRVGGLGAFLGLAACSIASPTYVTAGEGRTNEADDTAATPKAGTAAPAPGDSSGTKCDGPFAKVDVTKLTACEGGKGHCYAKEKVGEFAVQLIACADSTQVCVPDEVLEAGGGKLKTCTSIVGPGACFTASLVPEIEKRGGGALKRDVCDADQLCMPCADPTNNNAPTPFCQPIGVYEKACASGGSSTPAPPAPPPVPCCTTKGVSNGICVVETAVPEDQRSKVKQDVCPAANKCVPRAFVENKPVKCQSGLLGAGVCMDKCFDDMMGTASDIGLLSSAGCGATEVCVPCSFASSSGQKVPGCD